MIRIRGFTPLEIKRHIMFRNKTMTNKKRVDVNTKSNYISPLERSSLTGFTFIEVLFSAVIMSFIIGGIYGVLNVGNLTFNTDLGLLDLQQNARQAMNWMMRELREAKTTTIVSIGADDDQITFDTPNEPNIRYYRDLTDVNNNNIVNQIIREFPAGTYMGLGNDISGLRFCCDTDADGDTDACGAACSGLQQLEIQLMAEKSVRQRDLSFSLTERVRLRNE